VRENPPLDQDQDQDQDQAGAESGTVAITALVDALRPLDQEKTALLHAAAHSLRNPLTSIVGYLELLGDGLAGPITAEQGRVLRTVARNVVQLTALIDALEPGGPGEAAARRQGRDEPRPRG
jgi:signal transduction histidine kinase